MKYLVLFSLIFIGCQNAEKNEDVGPCGIIQDVRYKSDIKAIIRENCIGCHKDYIFYDSLNADINSGSFYKRVIQKRDMPPSGGLDTCDYIKIKRWLYNGHTSD
jgi:hypothetical protein